MARNNHNLVNHHNNPSYRSKQKWTNVFLYVLFIVSLISFEILLTTKLDHEMPPSHHSTLYLHSSSSFYLGMNNQNSQFNKLNSMLIAASVSTLSTSTSSSSSSSSSEEENTESSTEKPVEEAEKILEISENKNVDNEGKQWFEKKKKYKGTVLQ